MTEPRQVAEELQKTLLSGSYAWNDSGRFSGRAHVQQRLLSGLALAIGNEPVVHAEVRVEEETIHITVLTDTRVHKAYAEDNETLGTESWSRSSLMSVDLRGAPNVFAQLGDDQTATEVTLTFRGGQIVRLGGNQQNVASTLALRNLYPVLLASLS